MRGSNAVREAWWELARGVERARYALWCLPHHPRHVRPAIRLLGAYKQRGWFRSVSASASVDRGGRPLPLLTYPAIDWLEGVLCADHRVFEYGMGGSTLWMAERVRSVSSVERDASYAARFPLPSNAHVTIAVCADMLLHAEAGDAYVSAIERAGGPFDVVLIDGHARLSCVGPTHRALTEGGLIFFDNSDKPSYAPALEQLRELGYLRIDFSGTRPLGSLLGCTSVLSRDIAAWLRRASPPPYWGRSISELAWH